MGSENNPDPSPAVKAGCCIECGEPSYALVCVKCYVPDPARYRKVILWNPDDFEDDVWGERREVIVQDSWPGPHWTDDMDSPRYFRNHDPRRAAACDRRHNGRPYRREQADDPYWGYGMQGVAMKIEHLHRILLPDRLPIPVLIVLVTFPIWWQIVRRLIEKKG